MWLKKLDINIYVSLTWLIEQLRATTESHSKHNTSASMLQSPTLETFIPPQHSSPCKSPEQRHDHTQTLGQTATSDSSLSSRDYGLPAQNDNLRTLIVNCNSIRGKSSDLKNSHALYRTWYHLRVWIETVAWCTVLQTTKSYRVTIQETGWGANQWTEDKIQPSFWEVILTLAELTGTPNLYWGIVLSQGYARNW